MEGQLCVNALNVNNLSFQVYSTYIISQLNKKSFKDKSFTHSIPRLLRMSIHMMLATKIINLTNIFHHHHKLCQLSHQYHIDKLVKRSKFEN